jgi:hypothetical protein
MWTVVIAMVGLAVMVAGASSADAICVERDTYRDCVIKNGLAPPNSDNVISTAAYDDDYVYVRNAGCPPGWPSSGNAWDDCPSPGARTEVEVVDGGRVYDLRSYDTSRVTTNGAYLYYMRSAGYSILDVVEGTVVTRYVSGWTSERRRKSRCVPSHSPGGTSGCSRPNRPFGASYLPALPVRRNASRTFPRSGLGFKP